MFEYRATVLRVIDGDTVDLDVDLGFHVRLAMKVRLLGINTPELAFAQGQAAKAHLIELLAVPTPPLAPAGPSYIFQPVIIQTERDRTERYGRYLARLFLPDGTNVNQRMVTDGLAVLMGPYTP